MRLIKFALSLVLAVPPAALAKERVVLGSIAEVAARARAAQRSPTLRLGLTPANLDGKVWNAAKAGGHYMNEIVQFQALLVMMAVAHYQMLKQRAENERLAQGITGMDSVPAEGATSQELCAARAHDGASDTLCSGEFLIGMVAGAGLLTGSLLVNQALQAIVKTTKSRLALVQVLFALGNMGVMIVGGQAASMLWSEAVKLLPDSADVERAQGIGGRAAIAFTSFGWREFQASPDGAVWSKILANMNKILRADDELRSMWLTNLLRFGLRGELISSMLVLMAAPAAGSLAASGAVGVATATGAIAAGGVVAGASAFVLSFIIGAGLGFLALNSVFDANAHGAINRVLQDMRGWLNQRGLERNEIMLRSTALRFRAGYYPQARQDLYVASYSALLDSQLTERRTLRENLVTVGIEKVYEARLQIENLAKQLASAEKAMSTPEIAAQLVVQVDGELQTLQQAASRHRHEIEANRAKLREALAAAERGTLEVARATVGVYQYDMDLLESLSRDPQMVFPYQMSSRFTREIEGLTDLRAYLRFVFAAASDLMAKEWPLGERTPEVMKKDRYLAYQDLGEHYQLTFKEDKMTASLQTALH